MVQLERMSVNQARVRRLNDAPIDRTADYVLYWMQSARRLRSNHALDYALRCSRELGKPLVVYEGLRLDYPWASARISSFVIEGMAANATRAHTLGINYWPFVETSEASAWGLLRKVAARACLVVTDDFPCFILPEQTAKLAREPRAFFAIDNNGVIPLALLGTAPFAAAHLRRRMHNLFESAWAERSRVKPRFDEVSNARVEPPFALTDLTNVSALVGALPIDQSVLRLPNKPGGARAGAKQLELFLRNGLSIYADHRGEPAPPEELHGSGLSPYLHFGHLAIEDVLGAVLGKVEKAGGRTTPDRSNVAKRQGFYTDDPNANAFLDEALTWRDVGFVWHWTRRADTANLKRALPPWAYKTLEKHASDRRLYTYSMDAWESAATHDEIWNAAQRELLATGVIHNYMRMLWGKKVLEWSPTPETAYQTLVHLNNKYAVDGRNPNSYTGILWCFGLFDRPWAPERPVFGQVRYMSSENTAKKFKLRGYLDWVRALAR